MLYLDVRWKPRADLGYVTTYYHHVVVPRRRRDLSCVVIDELWKTNTGATVGGGRV